MKAKIGLYGRSRVERVLMLETLLLGRTPDTTHSEAHKPVDHTANQSRILTQETNN